MSSTTALVVIGLIQQAGHMLLVQQQGTEDPAPYWVAPGGLVEPGESLAEALIREVAEETGLRVGALGPLSYCTHIVHTEQQSQTIAFVFSITQWDGTPSSCDPDGEIQAVCWVAHREALDLLAQIGWRGMREPLLAFLRGEVGPGAVWQYREQNGDQLPV